MKKNQLIGLIPSILIGPLLLWGITAQLNLNELQGKVSQTKASATQEKSQVDYLNAIRAAHGVPAVAYDDGLNATAKAKVEDLITRQYFGHDTPDGQAFYALPFKTRPGLKFYGENIGQCYTSQEAMFKAYEASPGHLKNIIDPNYKLLGAYTQWDEKRQCFVNANEFGG